MLVFGLQLLTPAGPASQRPKSTTRSQVLFFFFVPLDNKGKGRGKKKKRKRKTTRKTTATIKTKKNRNKKQQITRDDSQGSTHVLGFRRTCCYGNAGCSSPRAGPHSQACEVRWSTQLLRLHRLLGLQWGHAWWGARGRSPPTFHAGTTFHKSTSSSPTGAGSGPRRLSSLPCFLLVEQKTSIKAWRSDGGALTDPHLRMPLLPPVYI